MAEKIKKHWSEALVLVIGLALVIVAGAIGVKFGVDDASADVNRTVTVTATVEEWIWFAISTDTATLSPSLVDTSGGVHIGSSTVNSNLEIGTNATSGWSVSIISASSALYNTSDIDKTIPSITANSTGTIYAGTSTYGANASDAGYATTRGTYYSNNWNSTDVGPLAESEIFISKLTANASTTVGILRIYAAATSSQAPGTYTDTITLTATAVP